MTSNVILSEAKNLFAAPIRAWRTDGSRAQHGYTPFKMCHWHILHKRGRKMSTGHFTILSEAKNLKVT